MSKITDVANAVEFGKSKLVPSLVQAALDEGCAPIDILEHGMIEVMALVGEKFKNNEIFVPEMLVAAKAMKKGVEILKPHLTSGEATTHGKVVIGTVAGDLHDIGKNLVAMMIESAGFEVIDLGIDVPIDQFVEAAAAPDVNIVAVSALLTTTMPAMQQTVAALNGLDRRRSFKVMVGGAPITQAFAEDIGADVYTSDAAAAAQAAKALMVG